jgi:bifunctional DNA-binding transcriptional regulator/antitoxin component of YhaV-PrlF toxin-antitoxin module
MNTPEGMPAVFELAVDECGRITLPAEFLEAQNLGPGDSILAFAGENGELELVTRRQSIRRAQERIGSVIAPDVDLVEQLLAERRAEATIK